MNYRHRDTFIYIYLFIFASETSANTTLFLLVHTFCQTAELFIVV